MWSKWMSNRGARFWLIQKSSTRCPYIVNGNSRQEITNESVRNSIESGDRSQFEIETPEENCDQTLVETHENSDREVPSKACIDNSLSLLMLKLRANYLVSHSAMDFFIKELNKVLTHVEKGILTVTDLKTSLRSLSSQKKRATPQAKITPSETVMLLQKYYNVRPT